jgi:hypothetical protein
MINKESALTNLSELNEILKKHNVKYWIQDGTLLGYYRDKDFINHDNDLDIGIKWKDFNKIVLFDIIDNGFILNAVNGFVDSSLVINFVKREVPVDFYFYYSNKSGIYHSALVKKPYVNGRYRVDYNYKDFDVKESKFLNCSCYVPEDELYFIETKYGKNWRTPDPKWISSMDPLNRIQTTIPIKKKHSKEDFQRWLNDKQE